MSEKRFTVMKKFDGSYVICDNGKMLVADDCCDLLNELNNDFEDCEKLLDSKDDFIHKFKKDIEELGISIKLFEDDIATKDKKIDELQATITKLRNEDIILKNKIEESENRFIVESVSIIDDCNEDKSRIAKVITDKEDLYSYDDLYEIVELLNDQQEQLDLYKEAILTMLGLLADKGIILSGVKDE